MAWARLAIMAVLGCTGCDKTQEKCEADLRNASALIQTGRLEDAQRTLGVELRKRCSGAPQLRTVERQLDAAKAKAETAASASAEQRQAGERNVVAMRSFLKWVADHAAAPHKVHDEKECWGPDDPEAGFCESEIPSESELRTISWRETDPRAFRFISESFPGGPEVTCAEFGAQQVRRWFLKGAGTHSHCVLGAEVDQRLFQLHLWIKNAQNERKYLRVFSAEYLKVAPHHLAQTLATQGTTL